MNAAIGTCVTVLALVISACVSDARVDAPTRASLVPTQTSERVGTNPHADGESAASSGASEDGSDIEIDDGEAVSEPYAAVAVDVSERASSHDDVSMGSVLRDFHIVREGSTVRVGGLAVDTAACPSTWSSTESEVVLFRDEWLANEWGLVANVEPISLATHAYFDARRQAAVASDRWPLLLSETLWEQAQAMSEDVATASAIASSSIALEHAPLPTGTRLLAMSAADQCLPVVSLTPAPIRDASTSVWNIPSPLAESRQIISHIDTLMHDIAQLEVRRVGMFVRSLDCCSYVKESPIELALVQLDRDESADEEWGQPSAFFHAPSGRQVTALMELGPDAIVLDALGCASTAIALRDAGYDGQILYVYPGCRLFETTLPNDGSARANIPKCIACSLNSTSNRWLESLRAGDRLVATVPIPGLNDSRATQHALEYIDSLERVAWHHGWGATLQRRIDGWILGWYTDVLLRGAQEIEQRFSEVRLPLRLRVLIAAYHLETPHPLFDTMVSTQVGDRRLTRELWWYGFDKQALSDGEPLVVPAQPGR